MNRRSSGGPLSLAGMMRGACLLIVALALVACGHSNSSSGPFTVGGTISGLNAGSVVLVNGSTTVTVAAGVTTWVFPGSFAADSSYSVSVLTQPVGELCEVTNGANAATLTADVSDVAVVCSPFGQWIWQAGLNTINGPGVYGTLGATSASNLPGARYSASSWTDSSGNFWLFGGVGYDAAGAVGNLNDLWEYSPSTGQWTWMSGGSGENASGVYGTQGTAAAANVPGARYAASSWTDASGNLWLFGGYGSDSTGSVGRLNDLWRFNPGTGQWTWVSGATANNAAAVYGTPGTAAAANVPGARSAATSWTDSSGNLWMFGGEGYGASGIVGDLNDLWRFSPGNGQWTWVNGGNGDNAPGVYGSQGTGAAANVPGARQAASSWTDSSSNLWLFGGYGYDSAGNLGYLNDLWVYNSNSQLWIWVTGDNVGNASGVYGTRGSPSMTAVPGSRQAASSWIDSSGNLWLFGGVGYDNANGLGSLNDLWQFSLTGRQWTWVDGSDTPNVAGGYGVQGAISASTTPGARYSASAWIDASGDLWLFGGAGFASTGNGYLNDLWKFVPP